MERTEPINFKTTKEHRRKWETILERERQAAEQPISKVQAFERIVEKLYKRNVT